MVIEAAKGMRPLLVGPLKGIAESVGAHSGVVVPRCNQARSARQLVAVLLALAAALFRPVVQRVFKIPGGLIEDDLEGVEHLFWHCVLNHAAVSFLRGLGFAARAMRPISVSSALSWIT